MQQDYQAYLEPFRRHEKDNGSPEVQIALLTAEIDGLQDHLKTHPSDVDAKRSLLKKVAKRRKYLKYLKENKLERYTVITKKLKIKA